MEVSWPLAVRGSGATPQSGRYWDGCQLLLGMDDISLLWTASRHRPVNLLSNGGYGCERVRRLIPRCLERLSSSSLMDVNIKPRADRSVFPVGLGMTAWTSARLRDMPSLTSSGNGRYLRTSSASLPMCSTRKSRKKRVSLHPLSDELTDLSQEHDDNMVGMIMLEAWSSASEGLEGVRRETALPRTL